MSNHTFLTSDVERLKELRDTILAKQASEAEQLAYIELLYQMGTIEYQLVSNWKWMARKKKLDAFRKGIMDTLLLGGRLILLEHAWDKAKAGLVPTPH